MTQGDDTAGGLASFDTTRATAMAFAQATDSGDLAAVARLLAPQCECADGATHARGAVAVAAMLRDATSWAERGFDDVRSNSSVADVSPGRVRLAVVIAWLRVPVRWHRLEFERTLEIRQNGSIARLSQHCDPAAARAFVGFARDSGAPPVPPGFGIASVSC